MKNLVLVTLTLMLTAINAKADLVCTSATATLKLHTLTNERLDADVLLTQRTKSTSFGASIVFEENAPLNSTKYHLFAFEEPSAILTVTTSSPIHRGGTFCGRTGCPESSLDGETVAVFTQGDMVLNFTCHVAAD